MSPVEYMELIIMSRDMAASHAMNFITLLFAYLTMVYLVGAKLKAYEVWIVTIIYSVFSAIPISGTVTAANQLRRIILDFRMQHSEKAELYLGEPAEISLGLLVGTILGTGWILSILFLVLTRRNGENT